MTVSVDQAIAKLLEPLGNVYAGYAPEGKPPPFIIYNHVGGSGLDTLSGPSGYETPVFQIDVYEKTYSAARVLARSVDLTLRGFSGIVTVDAEDLAIGYISKTSERAGLETQEAPILHRVTFEFKITYIDEGVM